MSFNGSGTYSLPSGNPVVSGTAISTAWSNATLADISTALNHTLCRDGQAVPTANLPMGGWKHTGLAAGSAAGDSLRYEQLFSQGAPIDIASAATTDIGASTTNFLTVTGTTTITSLGTSYNGPKMLRFSGALTLTHNATTLVLPTGANIVTAAGDTCIAIPKSTSSGTANGWAIIGYQRATGRALTPLAGAAVLLSTTAVGALSTTGTTYIDLVSSTVTTTRAGSKLRVVYVDSCVKVTNGGTCFLKFLEQTNLFAETYYSFAYDGYNNTVSPAFQTPAYTNAGTSVAIKLQWKRDTAGEVSTWGYGALEVWEVFA